MGAKNIYIFLLTILLSFYMVSALEIQSYKITATPINGNDVKNSIELIVYNDKETALTEASLNFAPDAKISEIRDSYDDLEYSIEEQVDKQKVTFTFTTPIQTGERRIITLQTTTNNIHASNGYIEYLLILVPKQDIASFTHILRLDNNAGLYNLADKEKYLIVPDATITETEEYILIQWETRLVKDIPTVFLTRFNQEQPLNWLEVIGLIATILSIGILVGILTNKAYKKYKQKKALRATKILNEREQAVLQDIIKNSPVKQHDLVKKLGYTKSNMSKILKRLELRALISVKKDGKVRIISMGEKLKKEL